MLRTTRAVLSARSVNTAQLFAQVEPQAEKMRNWRADWGEKMAPDVETGKAMLHKSKVESHGENYDSVTESNFPYPLVYGVILILWFLQTTVYVNYSDPSTNSPHHCWRPKNADGTTDFPVLPLSARPDFLDKVIVHEKAVNPH
eukprot:Rhum_TRINITY_DN14170_c13_g1::Rhum_TRINITY_DN14170_c13_g1_i1::g.72828::m.72828